MGKTVLDITMSLDEIDSLQGRIFSGDAGDAYPLIEAPKATEAIIADKQTYDLEAGRDNIYFCYQSEHIRLEVIGAMESHPVIHLKFC